jgi:hypothetical protein
MNTQRKNEEERNPRNDAQTFITNDRLMQRLKDILKVIVLDDFTGQE